MTLPLTAAIVRAAYDFLVETPPFDRWNLPDSDDLVFRAARDSGSHGWLTTKRNKKPELVVSRAIVGHTTTLLATVAHEMIHLHQYRTGMPQTHGEAFERLKAQVCKRHGFDPKSF